MSGQQTLDQLIVGSLLDVGSLGGASVSPTPGGDTSGGMAGFVARFWGQVGVGFYGSGVSTNAFVCVRGNAGNQAVVNGMFLGGLTCGATDGTGSGTPTCLQILFIANETFTGATHNGRISLRGAPTGSTVIRECVTVSPSVTAGDTDLSVFDVTKAALSRVTVGAADSGGVGFKLLRVPN